MKLNDIKKIIVSVATEELNCKSVLIDGSWGCGKTTAINKAIDELTSDKEFKKKIIYQSLFGIKDVCELGGCYSKAGKIIFSVGKSIGAPFTKLIPLVGEQIHESLENACNLFPENLPQKRNKVFIFDDLERVDKTFSYISLLGFFYQLMLRGCIIICVSSLNDLKKVDSDNKKQLPLFMEKAFDRIFYINEKPIEEIKNIFNDDEEISKIAITNINMFDENLRIALKTKRLYHEVVKGQEKYNYEFKNKVTTEQIFKACAVSIRAIYLNIELNQPDESNENKTYEKMLNESLPLPLNESVRKRIDDEIKKLSDHFVPQENDTIKELAKSLSFVEVHNNYDELIANYRLKEVKNKDENVVWSSIFYLSDEDKNKQFNLFKNNALKGQYVIDRAFADKVVDIIKYTDFDLNKDGFLNKVCDLVAERAKQDDLSAYNRFKDYNGFPIEAGGQKGQKIIKEITDRVSKIYKGSKTDKLKNEIDGYISKDNYFSLKTLLYEFAHSEKPSFMRYSFEKLLLENDFYLPNLSSSLDYDKWGYCHEVARYCNGKDDLTKAFIDVLKKISKEESSSKSALEKVHALIIYNFSPAIRSEFEEFLNSIGFDDFKK